MTVAILNIVRAILHSGLFVSVVNLASTSFALWNIKLATIVLICLCLQNR